MEEGSTCVKEVGGFWVPGGGGKEGAGLPLSTSCPCLFSGSVCWVLMCGSRKQKENSEEANRMGFLSRENGFPLR